MFVIIGVTLAFVSSLGVYAFMYYLPNKPENVWKSALGNTSKGYQRLIDVATSENTAKKYKTADIDGTFAFTSESTGFVTDGTFKASMDDRNAMFSGDFGMGIGRLDISTVLKDVDGSNMPDIYVKVGGITGMGNLAGLPKLDTLNNRWITVDHTFFDSFVEDNSVIQTPGADDIAEAAKVIGKVSDKYLFTANREDSAFTMRKYVGEEKQNGKNTMRYKISPNKRNLKRFIEELAADLDKTKLGEVVKEAHSAPFSEAADLDSVADAVDNLQGSETFDAWVNKDTKLLHKIRFTDAAHPQKNFLELLFNYDGGAEMPFVLNTSANQDGTESTMRLGVTLNADTNSYKINLDATENSGTADEVTLAIDLALKPGDGRVEVVAPKDAVSLVEAMDMVGISDYFNAMIGGIEESLQENVRTF